MIFFDPNFKKARKVIVKMLIRYGNYLQDLSTLFLQSAFFVENWRSAILHSSRNKVTYGYGCDGRMWMRTTKE